MSATIGQRIGLVIEEKHIKKVQFAERIGVHQTYVSQMISDKKVPSDRVIKDICEAYRVSEQWLRTGKGDMYLPKLEASLPAELTDDPMIRAMLEAYLDLDPHNRQVFQRFFVDVVARFKGESRSDSLAEARTNPLPTSLQPRPDESDQSASS